jgi:hypothetical protein
MIHTIRDIFSNVLHRVEIMDGRGFQPFAADLRGISLANLNLPAADFSGCNLEGVDLTGAKLRGSDFSFANLKNARLSFSDISNARFSHACLEGTAMYPLRLPARRFLVRKVWPRQRCCRDLQTVAFAVGAAKPGKAQPSSWPADCYGRED